jgi:hypothetical protein
MRQRPGRRPLRVRPTTTSPPYHPPPQCLGCWGVGTPACGLAQARERHRPWSPLRPRVGTSPRTPPPLDPTTPAGWHKPENTTALGAHCARGLAQARERHRPWSPLRPRVGSSPENATALGACNARGLALRGGATHRSSYTSKTFFPIGRACSASGMAGRRVQPRQRAVRDLPLPLPRHTWAASHRCYALQPLVDEPIRALLERAARGRPGIARAQPTWLPHHQIDGGVLHRRCQPTSRLHAPSRLAPRPPRLHHAQSLEGGGPPKAAPARDCTRVVLAGMPAGFRALLANATDADRACLATRRVAGGPAQWCFRG